jgi:hypothetical protein
MKPTLKSPETKVLKLQHDNLISGFAFEFNLRRYTMARWGAGDVLASAAMLSRIDLGPEPIAGYPQFWEARAARAAALWVGPSETLTKFLSTLSDVVPRPN